MLLKLAHKYIPLQVRRTLNRLIGRDKRLGLDGQERDAQWYDRTYETTEQYHCHYTASHYYFLWCVIVDRISRGHSKSVFDIGCGSGQVAHFLLDRGLPAYFGIDLSPTAIKQATARVPAFQFRAEDAFKSDLYETLNYDTVISLEFLEHVNDELAVLSRIKAGTRFLGSVPDFPYSSHVRYFSSCSEVLARYSHLFSDFEVVEFLAPSGNRFFLMDGIKL
jgi:2-polyprenyl-3-methyl-5-hydroxy-6-metoxy-1,4-benzoquinol methylase